MIITNPAAGSTRIQVSSQAAAVTPKIDMVRKTETTANGELKTTLTTKAGKPFATITQNSGATTIVDFFHGKAGEFIQAATKDGLIYTLQPGSELKTADTHIVMPGERAKATISTPHIAEFDGKAQTVTDQAVLLGAGVASRFEPISGDSTGVAKPAVPISTNRPLIRHIAEHMKTHGIKRIFTNTCVQPESVVKAMKDIDGVQVRIMNEAKEPHGDVTALYNAIVQGEVDMNKPVLVIFGDAITNANWSDAINTHKAKNAALTIIAKRVPDEEVHQFGIITSDQSGGQGQSGKILNFKEKPSLKEAGDARLANTAMAIISPEALKHYKAAIDKAYEGGANAGIMAVHFYPDIIKATQKGEIKDKDGKPMVAWVEEMKSGYWDDIGNPKSYIQNVLTYTKGLMGKLKEDTSNFIDDNGVIYWEDSKAQVTASNTKVTGNVVVAKQADKVKSRFSKSA